jgi:monofunctional biosynthetic peptidoglycan transglycosylase
MILLRKPALFPLHLQFQKEKKMFAGKKRHRSLWNRCFIFIVKTATALFVLSIALTVLYRWVNPPLTPLMVLRKIETGLPIKHRWRSLEKISPNMINCAVAAEDNRFPEHHGFDWEAIQQAIDERTKGKRQRGASTISQQTAKNVFLWPHRSWLRKGLEVYFTCLIETFWSKRRIMEVYLNVIEMGNGIYGSEAAARYYFHKPAQKLSLHEAALITAAYPDPRRRNPARPSKYLQTRAAHIILIVSKIGRQQFDGNNNNNTRKHP